MQSSLESAGVKSSLRACQNCAKAKAKCLPQPDSQDKTCARCFRLKKACIAPMRSNRKRRPPNTLNKTTQLEQKIESLVTLLSNARGITANAEQPTPPESQGRSEPSPPDLARIGGFPSSEQRWAPELAQRSTPAPSCSYCQSVPAPSFNAHETDSSSCSPLTDADYLLRLFRQKHEPHFPFIIIPSDVSAHDLHLQKPWLLRALMIVACQENRVRQLEMSKSFLMDTSAAMLLRGEKSLDMLQSLLIYTAWIYYYGHVVPTAHSTGIFHLTLAMIFDLGLTKSWPENDNPSEILVEAIASGVPFVGKKEIKRSLDEMRALLTCYILNSMTICFVKKIEGLHHSLHIDHCCKVLSEAAEYESDLVLVAMARLQAFIERIFSVASRRLNPDELKAPIWMQLKAIRVDLQSYWASLPLKIKENSLVLSYYQSTEVFLYEPGLYKWLFTTTNAEGCPNPRLDILYACLISAKNLLDNYMSLPVSHYVANSCLDLAHVGHGISALLKLTLIEEPGWDLVEVRQTANMNYYLEKFITKFEEAGATIDGYQMVPCRQSFLTGCSKAMGRVKTWYDTLVPKVPPAGEQHLQEQEQFVGMGMGMGMEGLMTDNISDYLSDAYWFELMGNNDLMPEPSRQHEM